MVNFYVHRIKSLGVETVEEYEALRGPIPAKWRNDVIAALEAAKNQ